MKVPGLYYVLLITTVIFSGCGGGSSSSNIGALPAPSSPTPLLAKPLGKTTDCPTLSLSAHSGMPGEQVTLSGLPEDMGDISFRVIANTEQGPLIDPLFTRADSTTGEAHFTVPVHPSHNPEGGIVELEPGDGDKACPALVFTITALPAAPTNYPETVALALERWVDKVLRKMGYDPDVLLTATPDTLPKADYGAWVVKQFASSDRAGALPVLAQHAIDNEDPLLGRLLKAINLEQRLTDAETALDAHADGVLLPATEGAAPRRLVRQDSRGIVHMPKASIHKQATAKTSSCDGMAFEPNELQINSADELSERILAAKNGFILDEPSIGQTLAGIAMADTLGTVDTGRAGPTMDFAGTGLFIASTLEAAKRALEPQSISDFKVTRVDELWVEDRPQDNLIFWDGAQVFAQGTSFNLSAATLNALVTAVGLTPGPLGVAATASGLFPDTVGRAVDNLTEGSCFRIDAPTYGPINVDDRQWTRTSIIGNTIEMAGDGHQQYRGIDIGVSTLRIFLKEAPFALTLPLYEDFPVSVEQLRIDITPGNTRVSTPGETIELTATATNAFTDPGYFSATLPTGSQGTLVQQHQDGDYYDVTFQSPNDVEHFPTHVLFTANHLTLPVGSLPRERLVEIDIGGEVRISPRNGCIPQNGTFEFSAEVNGLGDQSDIVWSTSAGNITPINDTQARLTAPASFGPVEVTATAVVDSTITDSVTISVSEDCLRKAWWPHAALKLDGNGTYAPGGPYCPASAHADLQQVVLEASGTPDSLATGQLDPSDAWYDRSERIGTNISHASTRYRLDSDTNQCNSITLYGAHTGHIEYTAESDGTLAAAIRSTLNTTCDTYPDGTEECASGAAYLGMPPAPTTGAYSLEVTEAQRLLLEGAFSCEKMSGNVTEMPLQVMVTRFHNGEPWFPETPSPTISPFGLSTPAGDPIMNPQLLTLACNQSTNVDFVLDAPPTGETHQVIIRISGGVRAPAALTAAGHDVDALYWVRLTPQ